MAQPKRAQAHKQGIKEIALERMEILFALAKQNIKPHPERAKRYVSLARKIGMRYRVRMPKALKNSFCKQCLALWIPGYNVRVRLLPRYGAVEYACTCGAARRLRYAGRQRKG